MGPATFELESIEDLKELAANAPETFKLLDDIRQGALASEVFAARTSTSTPDVPTNASVPPATDIPSCPHGVMKDLRGGKTKAGAAYKFMFYCAADAKDATKCKTGKNLGE